MKRYIAILLITVMALGAAACQKTPESPIVVGKNADNLIEQATGDDGSTVLPLREQLSAPDMMDVTVEILQSLHMLPSVCRKRIPFP